MNRNDAMRQHIVTPYWQVMAALVVASFLALLAPSAVSASDPPTWGGPGAFDGEFSGSWFPEIKADNAGRVRVVWDAAIGADSGSDAQTKVAVMISEYDPATSSWSAPRDIQLGAYGYVARPMLAYDDTYAYLLFRRSHMYYSRAPLTSDLTDARSWSKPVMLSANDSYWGQIAAPGDGTVVVVYSQFAGTVVDGKTDWRTALFMRRSLDYGQTWELPVRLSTSGDRVARSSLTVAPDNYTLFLAWDEGFDDLSGLGEPHRVSVMVSRDRGVTWQDNHTVEGSYEQSIAISNGATALLVYRSTEDDDIRYRQSDDAGVTWSDEQRVADAVLRPYLGYNNFERVSMAIDGDGRFLLSYVGQHAAAENGLAIFVATFADGMWTTPELLTAPDGFPAYARIAVALGNQMTLAYFERDAVFVDESDKTVWTVVGQSNARPIDARPYATPPETAAPAPTPAAVPTAPVVRPTVPEAPEPLDPSLLHVDSPGAATMQPILSIVLVTSVAIGALLVGSRLVRAVRER
jgi:hypothetical protein